MARYVIKAAEGRYQGLHGMVDFAVVDCDFEKDVHDIAKDMSFGVMDSYSTLEDEMDSDEITGIEDEDERAEYIRELEEENVDYTFARVKDDCPYTDEEIDSLIYNDYENFVATWGISE